MFYEEELKHLYPKDWPLVKLNELAYFEKGKGIAKKDITSKGKKAIIYGDIYTKHHFYIKNVSTYIDSKTASKSKLVKTNNVLLTGSGETAEEIGKAVAYLDEEELYAGGDIIIIKLKHNLNSLFLSYLLNFGNLRKRLSQLGQGNSVVHIYSSMLEDLSIPLPSIEEQNNITKVLLTWDKAIELKQQLIDLKKEQKIGLMQKLLTGEVRLPGFNEEWKVMKLEKLCSKMKSGGTPKSTNPKFYGGEIPFVKVNDITRQGKILKDAETTITEQGLINSSAWLVPANSILYSMYASIGFVSINKMPVTTNQAIMSMIPNDDVNIDFLYYQLVKYKTKVNSIIETGTQGNLNAKLVKSFSIHLPQYEEQLAIATILNAAESHIELLENELDALKEQKKGLMQQLLTGKTRVKV
ncbi:restriction endonuclease subunit S [Alkalibacterium sp. m-11]